MTRAGMMTEMGWEVDEEMNRNRTAEANGMNLEVNSKDEVMHIWMSDSNFQGGDGWRARKSDNRWRAGTARRLKRDKVVNIARLSGCKNFVGERDLNLAHEMTPPPVNIPPGDNPLAKIWKLAQTRTSDPNRPAGGVMVIVRSVCLSVCLPVCHFVSRITVTNALTGVDQTW